MQGWQTFRSGVGGICPGLPLLALSALVEHREACAERDTKQTQEKIETIGQGGGMV